MSSSPRAVAAPRLTPRVPAGLRGRLVVSTLAGVGGAVAAIAATLPWLTFFGGLVPVTGTAGVAGQVALALGGTSVALAVIYGIVASSATRWAIALTGAALLAVAGWVAVNLITSLPALQADPLTVAAPGPGVPMLVLGAALVFATFFIAPAGADVAARRPLSLPIGRVRPLLPVSLAFAGLVHLSLGPGHLAESTLIGGSMMLGGLAQLGLALVAARSPRVTRLIGSAIVVLSVALVLAWLAAVTVGLPVEPHPHAAAAITDGHGGLGHVESVSPIGLATAAAEVLTIGVVLAIRSSRGARA